MMQSDLSRARAWSIRRAELVDVPAVSRLLGVPHDPGHPLAGSSDEAITSATRLVLTHVALEMGEFWVATDEDEHVLAALVLLPAGEGYADGERTVRLAVRQELGLMLLPRPEQALAAVPEPHWLLLPAAPDGTDPILADLLAAALPAVEASGMPVLSVQSGMLSPALVEAGFAALPARSMSSGSAALRLGAPAAVAV